MSNKDFDKIGLVPAAGKASRLSTIPCSKEIIPVGFTDNSDRIKVAASCLFESFSAAEIDRAYMVTRKGKWDIPQYYGTGSQFGYPLAYLFTEPTPGTHHTLNLANNFVQDSLVLLGFPDVLFKPKNAYKRLLNKQQQSNADVVLGLFKATNPNGADMLDLGSGGQLKKIVIKPKETDLKYTWVVAVWNPRFSDFLNGFVTRKAKKYATEIGREVYIGDAIQHALEYGLDVETVLFPDGEYIDIGTISGYKKGTFNK